MKLKLNDGQKETLIELFGMFKGLPYVFGAEVSPRLTPDYIVKNRIPFDCSELVEYVYRRLGIIVPDGSWNQYGHSLPVTNNVFEVGDLAFKAHPQTGVVYHVAIVSGIYPYKVFEAKGKDYGCVFTNLQAFRRTKSFSGIRRFNCDMIKFA